jgi:hypothetical protein
MTIRLACVLAIALLSILSACKDEKKDPMVPDNPNHDPLMLDAGGFGDAEPVAPPAK